MTVALQEQLSDEAIAIATNCSGPLAVVCSGLVRPGGSWLFTTATLPAGVLGAVLYSFNARRLSDIGLDLGFDDVVADLMCETLSFGVKGDCDDYRRFKQAYDEAGTFAGVPMGVAYGPALVAEVWRACPGDLDKVVTVTASYSAVAGRSFGGFGRVFDISSYHATLVHGDRSGSHTVLYIQNGGANCASVALWFQSQDACRQSLLCDAFTLARVRRRSWTPPTAWAPTGPAVPG